MSTPARLDERYDRRLAKVRSAITKFEAMPAAECELQVNDGRLLSLDCAMFDIGVGGNLIGREFKSLNFMFDARRSSFEPITLDQMLPGANLAMIKKSCPSWAVDPQKATVFPGRNGFVFQADPGHPTPVDHCLVPYAAVAELVGCGPAAVMAGYAPRVAPAARLTTGFVTVTDSEFPALRWTQFVSPDAEQAKRLAPLNGEIEKVIAKWRTRDKWGLGSYCSPHILDGVISMPKLNKTVGVGGSVLKALPTWTHRDLERFVIPGAVIAFDLELDVESPRGNSEREKVHCVSSFRELGTSLKALVTAATRATR